MIIIRDKGRTVYEMESDLSVRGGALGKVFFARNAATKETVVVKGVMPGVVDEASLVTEIRSKIQDSAKHLVKIIDSNIFSEELSRIYPGYKFHIESAAKGRELKAIIRDEISSGKRQLTLKDRLEIASQAAEVFQIVNRAGFAYLDHKPTDHYFWDSESRNLTIIDWNATRRNPSLSDIENDLESFFETIFPVLNPAYVKKESSEDIDYSLHPLAWSFPKGDHRHDSFALTYPVWILLQQLSFRKMLNLYPTWDSFRDDLYAIQANNADLPSFRSLEIAVPALPNFLDALEVVKRLLRVQLSDKSYEIPEVLRDAEKYSRIALRTAVGFQPTETRNMESQRKAFVACWLARMLAPDQDSIYACFELTRLNLYMDSDPLRKLTAETIREASQNNTVNRLRLSDKLEKLGLSAIEQIELNRTAKILRAYDIYCQIPGKRNDIKISLLSESVKLDPLFIRYRDELDYANKNKRITDEFNRLYKEFIEENDRQKIIQYENRLNSFRLVDEEERAKKQRALDRIADAKKKQEIYQIYSSGMHSFSSSEIRKVSEKLRMHYSIEVEDPDLRRLEKRAEDIEKSEITLSQIRKIADPFEQNRILWEAQSDKPLIANIDGYDDLRKKINEDLIKIRAEKVISEINGIGIPSSPNIHEAKRILQRFSEIKNRSGSQGKENFHRLPEIFERVGEIREYLLETIWFELGANQIASARDLCDLMCQEGFRVTGKILDQFPIIDEIIESVSERKWHVVIDKLNGLNERLRFSAFYASLSEISEIGLRIPNIQDAKEVEYTLKRLDQLLIKEQSFGKELCEVLRRELDLFVQSHPEIIEGQNLAYFPYLTNRLSHERRDLLQNISFLHDLSKFRPDQWDSIARDALEKVRSDNRDISEREQNFILRFDSEYNYRRQQIQQQNASTVEKRTDEIPSRRRERSRKKRDVWFIVLMSLLILTLAFVILVVVNILNSSEPQSNEAILPTKNESETDFVAAKTESRTPFAEVVTSSPTTKPTATEVPTATEAPIIKMSIAQRSLAGGDVLLYKDDVGNDPIGIFSGSAKLDFLLFPTIEAENLPERTKVLVKVQVDKDFEGKLLQLSGGNILIFADDGKQAGNLTNLSRDEKDRNYFLEDSPVAAFYFNILAQEQSQDSTQASTVDPISAGRVYLWMLGYLLNTDINGAIKHDIDVSQSEIPDALQKADRQLSRNENPLYKVINNKPGQGEIIIFSDRYMKNLILKLYNKSEFPEIFATDIGDGSFPENKSPLRIAVQLGVVKDQDLGALIPGQTQVLTTSRNEAGLFSTGKIPEEAQIDCGKYPFRSGSEEIQTICVEGYLEYDSALMKIEE